MCPNILASGFRHLTFSEFKGLNSPDKGRSGWLCDPQVISFVSVEISFVSCTKVRIYKKKKGSKNRCRPNKQTDTPELYRESSIHTRITDSEMGSQWAASADYCFFDFPT